MQPLAEAGITLAGGGAWMLLMVGFLRLIDPGPRESGDIFLQARARGIRLTIPIMFRLGPAFIAVGLVLILVGFLS